ncbi:MAG: hypothetical protein GXY33_22220 [Phycisphaerae bacterium]|nr:hypothetical protein [Phycisphaerae bacterium]
MTREASLVHIGLVAALCLAMAGCESSARKAERLGAFLQEKRSPVTGIEYRVLPPDVLSFSSRYVREIDQVRQKVRPDGKISLPLVGEVFVAGRTLQEIGHEVAWAAKRYYQRVDVTVYVEQYNSQRIYVFGQVSRAGPLPWTGADTLLDVLAQAQPNNLAWPEKIKVVRGAPPKRGGYLPGGQDDSGELAGELIINLKDMIEKGDMSHNILLWPDDVVYVPPSPTAAVGLTLQQVLFPLYPVIQATQLPIAVDQAADIGKGDDK